MKLPGFSISLALTLSTAVLVAAPQLARAQVLPDRATLDSILTSSTTEDFEAYNVTTGTAEIGESFLDSTTTFNGQGPNLVVPGVSFQSASTLQWDDVNYFGAPSKQLLANSTLLSIDFTAGGVQAYGVDLSSFDGFIQNAIVTTYAADDTTILFTSSDFALATGTGTFFGYQSAGGIGRVTLQGTVQTWSPIIDNLTFGTIAPSAAPEPGTLALLALGGGSLVLLKRRKR